MNGKKYEKVVWIFFWRFLVDKCFYYWMGKMSLIKSNILWRHKAHRIVTRSILLGRNDLSSGEFVVILCVPGWFEPYVSNRGFGWLGSEWFFLLSRMSSWGRVDSGLYVVIILENSVTPSILIRRGCFYLCLFIPLVIAIVGLWFCILMKVGGLKLPQPAETDNIGSLLLISFVNIQLSLRRELDSFFAAYASLMIF